MGSGTITLAAIGELLLGAFRILTGLGIVGWIAFASMIVIYLLGAVSVRGVLTVIRREQVAARRAHHQIAKAASKESHNKEDEDEADGDRSVPVDLPVDDSFTSKTYQLVKSLGDLPNPQVSVIQEFIRQYEPSGLNRQRVTQNVLLLIGLIGTVFGLATAVGEIQLDFSTVPLGEEVQTYAATSFEAVLAKLPTAFASTIWGILFALLFGPFVSSAESEVSEFVNDFEFKVLHEWVPVLWPKSIESQVRDLTALVEQTQQAISDAGLVIEKSSDELGAMLEGVSNEMGGHVQNLTKATDDSHELFSKLSGEVNSSVTALAESSDAVSSSVKHLRGVHAEMNEIYKSMEQFFKEEQAEVKRQIDATLSTTQDQQDQVRDFTTGLYSQLENVTQSLVKGTTVFNEAREEFRDEFGRIGVILAEEVGRVTEGTSNRFSETMKELGAINSALTKEVGQLRGALEQGIRNDDDIATIASIVKLAEEFGNRTQDIAKISEALTSLVARVEEEYSAAEAASTVDMDEKTPDESEPKPSEEISESRSGFGGLSTIFRRRGEQE